MNMIYIKPREGTLVRDPVTLEPLPAEGAEKPRTPHWVRRLRSGDVIECERPDRAESEAQ